MKQPIRLVFSDLDGTLLNDQKQLPEDLEEVLLLLKAQGALFYTASGRDYLTQKHLFGPLAEQINFVCDNGAYIVEQGKPVFISIMERSHWVSVIETLHRTLPQAHCVFCGTRGSYSLPFAHLPAIAREIHKVYSGLTPLDRLEDLQDDIFKISVCLPGRAEETLLPVLQAACAGRLSARLTDPSFVDLMNLGITKGSAVQRIQKAAGISPAQTAVFGDYYNDVEMLQYSTYSYIMQNVPCQMVQYGNYRAPDNNHAGVTATLRQLFQPAENPK